MHHKKIPFFLFAADDTSFPKIGGDDKWLGGLKISGELTGDRDISGGEATTGSPPPPLPIGFFPKNSWGNNTFDTPNIATGFWSNTVWVTDAWIIPVLIPTDPLTLEMFSVKLPAPFCSVANVGWTGFTIDSKEPKG